MNDIRYYQDEEYGVPHIYRHGIYENEVEEALRRTLEDRVGRNGTRVAIGQTKVGRYICIIYSLDVSAHDLFVITAYELKGKQLTAFKRRRRRKQ